MFDTMGFSYIGFIFLCCIIIPNIAFGFNVPTDNLPVRENKVLLMLERVGQVLCTIFLLILTDFKIYKAGYWFIWLIVSFVLMGLYLICWGRYFAGRHTSKDLYRPFLGIPLPLAVLPVASVFSLSVYGKVAVLGIAAVVFGIGHIGITMQHWAAVKKHNWKFKF